MLYDEDGKKLLIHFLPSCGGTMSSMWLAAKRIQGSESTDLVEVLGEEWFTYPGSEALTELTSSCEQIHGTLDLEGIVTHFASYKHLHKFDSVPTDAGRELPLDQRTVAHTLLPLTLVGGKYFYENGEANIELRGLVQLGPTLGTPYAHLASLIWIEDSGLSAKILDYQAKDGVAERAAKLSVIDYTKAPLLVAATEAAKQALGI